MLGSIKKVKFFIKALFLFFSKERIYYSKIENINFGKYSSITLENEASITFKGKFTCRRFVLFKASAGHIEIGDNLFLNNYCSITCREKILIGDNCLFGEGVKIYDHDHVFKYNDLICQQGFKTGSVKIGNNVWIGSNVVILKGTVIGDNSVIAAGEVVSGVYPESSLIKSSRDNAITHIDRNHHGEI